MKNKCFLIFPFLGLLLLSACDKDEPNNDIVDFGDAPSASIISTGSVQVITESTIRYHIVVFDGPGGYTASIVETEEGSVFVDVGFSAIPNSGSELRAYADAIGKPISVIITHAHLDHFSNIDQFTDVTVYAETAVAAILKADANFSALYTGDVTTVSDSQTIYGLAFTFDKVSAAEAGENGYVYIPDTEIVFPADLVYNQTHLYIREYSPNTAPDEIDNWIAGLNTIKVAFGDYKNMVAGHNGLRTDIITVVDENIQYLQDAQALIKGTKTLAEGGTASSAQEVVDELKKLYPNYLNGGADLSLPDAFFPGDPGADWF